MSFRALSLVALLGCGFAFPATAYDSRMIVTYDNQTHVEAVGDVEHDHATDVPARTIVNSDPVHHSSALNQGRWYTIHLRAKDLGACKVVVALYLSPVACTLDGRVDHVLRCDSACSTSGNNVSVTVKAMWP